MSAQAAVLLHDGYESEISLEGRSTTREYKVRCSFGDNETVALGASGLPSIGDAHPSWTAAKCNSLKAKPWVDDTRTLWRVTVRYRTPTDNDTLEDPTARDDVVSVETAPYEVPAIKDVFTDVPVQNSATDAFDPPATKQQSRLLLMVNMNIASASWAPYIAQTYVDTVNSVAMTIGGVYGIAQTFRMVRIKGAKRWDNSGNSYYEVSYEIEYNADTHSLQLLDQGLRELVIVDAAYKPQRIKDSANGKEVQRPVKLNGAGAPLPYGGTSVFGTWYIYPALDWTGLGLPSSA